MLNDRSAPLPFLATRRSAKPRELVAPGPDAATLERMLAIAARTPDHGKLAPWRFIVVGDREAFAVLLEEAFRRDNPAARPDEFANVEQFARQAPCLVTVLSSPVAESRIPRWEQELSAGAAAMNLLHAANALGFAGGWLTGWAAFSPHVLAGLGGRSEERIAGFVFIGTPARTPEERPRPDPAKVVSYWP